MYVPQLMASPQAAQHHQPVGDMSKKRGFDGDAAALSYDGDVAMPMQGAGAAAGTGAGGGASLKRRR